MVDIIIPAYNCKNTLPRALSSIVTQTGKDKCIVTIVDDCSTEDLVPIINDFKKYIKINYIRNDKNLKYPGLVRQVGLDNTISPFVMFLDADDILEPAAVEILYKEIRKSDIDLIIGYFYRQDENYNLSLMDEHQTTWLHGNIYRRAFLEKNNIRFPGGYNEDGAFNTQCYMLTDKIGVLKRPMMYWLHNKSSVTRKENDFSLKHADDVVNTLAFAYKNIFNQDKHCEKAIKNMGSHWALFLNLVNQVHFKNEKIFIESEKRLTNALLNFVSNVNVKSLSKKEQDLFKSGYIIGLKKHFANSKPMYILEDFLPTYGIDIKIKSIDLI